MPRPTLAGYPLALLISGLLLCGASHAAERKPLAPEVLALIPQVLQVPDAAGRAAIMGAHPEAATEDFVYAILKQAEDMTNGGRFDEALHAQTVAREIAERAKLPSLTLGVCDWMRAITLQTCGRGAEAVDVLASAMQAVRDSKNTALISMIMRDQAELLEDLGRLPEARAAVEEALKLAQEFGADQLRCEALQLAASLDAALGDLAAALKEAQEAVGLAAAGGKPSNHAAALMKLGNVQKDLGSYEQALASDQQALALYREGNNINGVPSALNACAVDLKNLGRYQEALAHYEQGLAAAEQGKRPGIRAGIQDNMGSVLLLLGDRDQAAQLHQQAYETYRQTGDRRGQALAQNHLGLLEKGRGRTDPALSHFAEALALYQETGSVPDQVMVLTNQGNALSDAGRRDDALAAAREAVDLCAKLESNPELAATTYFNVALFQDELGRKDAYRDCVEKAWALAQDRTSPALRAAILGELASVKRKDGDPRGSDDLLAQAVALAPPGSPEHLNLLAQHAGAAFEEGRRADAVARATDGLQLARRLGRRRPEAEFLLTLGTALLPQKQEQPDQAPPDSAQAAKHLEQAVTIAEELALPQLVESTHYFCGKAYAGLGDNEKTLTHYLAAARAMESIREQVGGQAQRLRLASQAARLCRLISLRYAAAGEVGKSFAWAESAKARVLADALAEREVAPAGGGGHVSAELAGKQRIALAAIGTASGKITQEMAKPPERRSQDALKQWASVRTEAEDDLRLVQLEMRRRDPAYAALRYPQPLDVAAAQASIPKDTVLVDYVLEDESAVALVVTSDGARVCSLPSNAREARELWGKMEATIQMAKDPSARADPRAYALHAHGLYTRFVEPVLSARPTKPSRLLIAPDGVLHYVPFAALVTKPPTGAKVQFAGLSYLGRETVVGYVPSATVLAMLLKSREAPTEQRHLVAFCDPSLPSREGAAPIPADTRAAVTRAIGSWAPLKAAAQEGAAIKALWGEAATVFSGGQADERTAKLQAASASCLHFAAHGVADDDSPLYSALALSPDPTEASQPAEDGYLYAYEVMQLERTAPLVVLSACETALGAEADGEGLVGLVRAFLSAGSRAVVASLWSVDDEATAALMRAFYEGLQKGVPPDAALAAAQRQAMQGKLRGAASASAPYFWAAFAPYGDTTLPLVPAPGR